MGALAVAGGGRGLRRLGSMQVCARGGRPGGRLPIPARSGSISPRIHASGNADAHISLHRQTRKHIRFPLSLRATATTTPALCYIPPQTAPATRFCRSTSPTFTRLPRALGSAGLRLSRARTEPSLCTLAVPGRDPPLPSHQRPSPPRSSPRSHTRQTVQPSPPPAHAHGWPRPAPVPSRHTFRLLRNSSSFRQSRPAACPLCLTHPPRRPPC